MGPLERIELPGRVDPAAAFRCLAATHDDLVWSDRDGFIGVGTTAPVIEPRAAADGLGHLLADLRRRLPTGRGASAVLGWWGFIGYELGVAAHGLPVPETDEPAAAFLFADVGVEFGSGATVVIGLPGRASEVSALAALLAPLVGMAASVGDRPPPPDWRWRHERDHYLGLIESCRRSIAAGDAYQLCLTDRIDLDLPGPTDPFDVFLRLRGGDDLRGAELQGAGVLRIGGTTLISASPETLLTVDAAGRAVSRPIKGTRPRGIDAEEDRGLADELRRDEKERAENVMIVDLVRNDLARVAAVGSVEVTELFGVESYPSVHQLVSTVVADLVGDPLDAIGALFPAGSMTGAPKHAAMRILAGLEAGPRGAYAGAWGRISVDGTLALAVVIRSIVLRGARATIGTGGGITILSEPEAEWREIELKARPLLAALGVRTPPSG